MRILEQLAASLRESSDAAVGAVRWSERELLEREHGKLVDWIGAGSGLDTPSVDRLLSALGAFFESHEVDSMGQARLLSYGCTQRFNGTSCLLEDRRLFGLFLIHLDKNHGDVRRFRKCYRGLLHGYFSYDPNRDDVPVTGKENWADLREYLAKRKGRLSTKGTDPEWVTALEEHGNLLTAKPCERYGTAALQGDTSAFDDIRSRLEIRDDSWLIQALIDAQIDAAVKLPDDQFKSVLRFVLPLIERHPLIVDRTLGRVINRYSACRTREIDAGLRDLSVRQWKNPWLPSNAARWGSVEPKAREMIAGWLKLQLISQFFSLLAEDGSNDTRRVEFWKGYHDKIQDMYFAMGDAAYYNRSKDFQEIRKAMDGRLLHLHKAGQPSNNAFIMKIGDYVVVEFGTAGNAAYIFRDGEDLPFQLRGMVVGNGSELKNAQSEAYVDRMIHRDTLEGAWEDRFTSILTSRVGKRAATTPKKASVAADLIRVRAEPQGSFAAVLKTIANQHDLIITDLREKGGRIWVEGKRSLTKEAKTRLEGLGFRWSERRNAYYRAE